MSEPSNKELRERLKKIDAVVSAMAAELAEQRADIEEILRAINREFANVTTT
ncbi:MAG: hypothetical protein ABUS51_08545 [Acidobacteriota bacterium]